MDTIEDQLTELVTSREPVLRASPEAVGRAVAEQLGGIAPREYGTWVWYPWSGRLVHLLPREEFRLVRTDRNRGQIERPEQRRLLGQRVGIIGLSVGGSAALTFAMEGIGGAFKLADFDTLSVSNLNRLRAGVHHLGREQVRDRGPPDARDRPLAGHRDLHRRSDRRHDGRVLHRRRGPHRPARRGVRHPLREGRRPRAARAPGHPGRDGRERPRDCSTSNASTSNPTGPCSTACSATPRPAT